MIVKPGIGTRDSGEGEGEGEGEGAEAPKRQLLELLDFCFRPMPETSSGRGASPHRR